VRIGAPAMAAACTAAAPGATQVFRAKFIFGAPTDLASAAIDSGRRMGKDRVIQGDKTVKGLLPVRVG
jgi:hypothetical protein